MSLQERKGQKAIEEEVDSSEDTITEMVKDHSEEDPEDHLVDIVRKDKREKEESSEKEESQEKIDKEENQDKEGNPDREENQEKVEPIIDSSDLTDTKMKETFGEKEEHEEATRKDQPMEDLKDQAMMMIEHSKEEGLTKDKTEDLEDPNVENTMATVMNNDLLSFKSIFMKIYENITENSTLKKI